MTKKRFFTNRRFLAYVRLLRQLHHLIASGKDDAKQGKALRDGMDAPIKDLRAREIGCLKGIAADFGTLTGPARQPLPAPPDFEQQRSRALAAIQRRNFVKALELVRQIEPYVQPVQVCVMRTLIWVNEEVADIAGDFLRRASDLSMQDSLWKPTYSFSSPSLNPNPDPWYMNPMSSLLNFMYDPGQP